MQIFGLLSSLSKNKASDLHLKVGRPPLLRVMGRLIPTKSEKLSTQAMQALVYPLLNEKQVEKFERDLELDFAVSVPNEGRFRFNIYKQKGNTGVVVRRIPPEIPTLDKLNLPKVIKDIASKDRGLVLVTGATGSGKSSTLAAIIEYINETTPSHILTLEDPIEFVYEDKMSTVNQREVGLDTKSYAAALKQALRQDPDVILVGEMRDKETIEIALTAAETGHLVLSTLHSSDAKQTVDRIIDTFMPEQQQQVRIQLSATLVAVISQRLVPLATGQGRTAAVEIMINSPTIKKLILEGSTGMIADAINSSVTYYRMQSFNLDLENLVKRGLITPQVALANSSNPDDLKLRMSGIMSGSEGVNAMGDV